MASNLLDVTHKAVGKLLGKKPCDEWDDSAENEKEHQCTIGAL